jgi:hypothetical protein
MADKKLVKKLPLIKSKEQLSMIISGLSDQGFGYFTSDWTAHDKKVDYLIQKNNILNISDKDFDRELKSLLNNMTNYNDIDKTIKKFFKKYKPDDKIKELINKFYLVADAGGMPPSDSHPDTKSIFDWVKFKEKYSIKEENVFGYQVRVYDLDKKYIKINFQFGWTEKHNFDELYKLIYNETPNEWSYKDTGIWLDLGKIEIKTFQNGTMNIKGDLKKLTTYFYEQITKRSVIIFYNKKKEIFKVKE